VADLYWLWNDALLDVSVESGWVDVTKQVTEFSLV
jgi:hypothetical protein